MELMKLNAWGQEYELGLMVSNYVLHDNLAIQLYCVDDNAVEPFAMLTVNFDSKCNPVCAFVDINDCPWAIRLIDEYGLGKLTGRTMRSGYCVYLEYQFDMERLEHYDISESYDRMVEDRSYNRDHDRDDESR